MTETVPDDTTELQIPWRSHARWAIVGGGFLGMELAKQLTAAGKKVTILEGAPHLGGLADMWNLGDITWDRHYHVILMSDLRTRQMLAELDLEKELQWVETKTGFYTNGKLYSMSNSMEFLKFPPLGLISKFRLAATIMKASRIQDWKYLEQVSCVEWLTKWSGRKTTEKIWIPLLRAKLGENYQLASAAFIWAIIARMYAARRSGLKKEMFGYVTGGYAPVIERFAEQLTDAGVTIRRNAKVTNIIPMRTRFNIEFQDESTEEFEKVIITAASPTAAKMCTTFTEDEKAKLNALRYQGIVCASVVLKKPLAHYYVTNITDPSPFTAVIEMTALVPPDDFGGSHLVYLPKYVAPDDPLFEKTDHQIRESFLAGLAKMYPHFTTDDVLAFRVSRVRNVLAISTLNYSANLPPMTTSIPGLYLVNSSHIVNGTLNINETLQLADRAMKELFTEIPTTV